MRFDASRFRAVRGSPSGDSRNVARAEETSLELWAEPQLHALEVRVFEARGVLQTVSDRAINADVREPDQAELNRGLSIDDESDCCESNRKYIGVRSVVGRRSDGRPGQISDHRQVGCQYKRDKEPPRIISMEVESDRCDRDSEAFGA